jgi:DNA-cytosine methyltransferase
MKYLSLFSGIGGFERALELKYKSKAKCIGFSEIDNAAISVYESHYPKHFNLGNVTKITEEVIIAQFKKHKGCDLIVGGFPCNDLSSLNKARKGLKGEKSSLFFEMIRIIKILMKLNPNLKILVENNASMANKWKIAITKELSKVMKAQVYCNYIDSGAMVVQKRRRLYWTLNQIPEYTGGRIQTWDDVLDPVADVTEYIISDKYLANLNGIFFDNKGPTVRQSLMVKKTKNGCYEFYTEETIGGRSRWCTSNHSDNGIPGQIRYTYPIGNARCITTNPRDNTLLDRRDCRPNQFIVRFFTPNELSRFFGFPEDYISKKLGKYTVYRLYGMTIVIPVILCILEYL